MARGKAGTDSRASQPTQPSLTQLLFLAAPYSLPPKGHQAVVTLYKGVARSTPGGRSQPGASTSPTHFHGKEQVKGRMLKLTASIAGKLLSAIAFQFGAQTHAP